MGPVESVRTVLTKKYATFSGRAARSEYWWFVFFFSIVQIVALFLSAFVADKFGVGGAAFIISGLVFLALFLPSLAVLVRRLHDRNYSGWWIPVFLIATFIVVFVVTFITNSDRIANAISLGIDVGLVVFLAQRGSVGPNRFGADPLSPDHSSAVFS